MKATFISYMDVLENFPVQTYPQMYLFNVSAIAIKANNIVICKYILPANGSVKALQDNNLTIF